MNIDIKNPANFIASSMFVSKEHARYYLQGVLIEPLNTDGSVCVATDGKHLFASHMPATNVTDPVLINLDKSMAGKDAWSKMVSIQISDGIAKGIDESERVVLTAPVTFNDGTFPAWRNILPSDTPSLSTADDLDIGRDVSFDPSSLTLFDKAARMIAGHRSATAVMRPNGASTAKICFEDSGTRGLLMPRVKRDACVTSRPVWWNS